MGVSCAVILSFRIDTYGCLMSKQKFLSNNPFLTLNFTKNDDFFKWQKVTLLVRNILGHPILKQF